MACFCKQENKVNIVHAYHNNNLIASHCNYIQIVYCPKICVSQSLIKCNDNEKIARVIIKVINFEQTDFPNISLINNINPSPKEIIFNHLDGIATFNKDTLKVDFDIVPELSSLTVDFYAFFEDVNEIESFIYISDNCKINNPNRKFKRCRSSLKF